MASTATTATPLGTVKPASMEDMVADAIRKQLLTSAALRKEVVESTPAVPAAPAKKKERPALKAGQKYASDVLSIKLSSDADFGVTVLDAASIPPQVAALIPKPDADYKIQPDAAVRLLRAWEEGDKSMITGPTGSGKSSLVKLCAALTNRPLIRINMTADTESSTLFGQQEVEIGVGTVWRDGPVTEAVRYGAILMIDEWELMSPEIGMGMQWLLEDDGCLFLKEKPGTSEEKMIVPHGNFRVVYLGNTVGQGDDTGNHAGTQVQNTATIDRFQTTIVLGYLDQKHEEGIISKRCPDLAAGVAEKMVKLAHLVRDAQQQGTLSLTMSPRTLINWGRKIQSWGDIKVAFTIAYLDKLRTTDRKVVSEMYNKVFGR